MNNPYIFAITLNKITAKDTIKRIIENQTNEENKKYVTKSFQEKLISEKVENAMNALRHELEARLEEDESLKDLTVNSSEGNVL